MSSSWTSDLALLDGSLTLPCESLENLTALQTVDVAAVLKQLKTATDAVNRLRSAVMEVLPEASWQTRDELDELLACAEWIVGARSRLLALATELECGNIVHRRVHRVDQLNQLRAQAITELRFFVESRGEPPILRGPEVDKWVDWACSLKEPEDSAALEALHKGFARLDDFITDLEPGMWVPKTSSETPLSNGVELRSLIHEVREALRSRLLTLATELERGRIVHHRVLRINQLNELREQAIKELWFRANTESEPPSLPGPEASHWVEWACRLKEPEDAEALETLRSGFAHLDDFIANLEPDMWIGGGAKPAEVEPEPWKPVANESRQKDLESQNSRSLPESASPPMAERPAPASQPLSPHETENSASQGFMTVLQTRAQKIPWMKWRIPLAVAAVLLLLAVAIGIWIWHRVHAKASASIARVTPVAMPSGSENTPPNPPEAAADSKSNAGSTTPQNEMQSKHGDTGNASKQVLTNQPAAKASKSAKGSTAAPVIVLPNEVASSRKGRSAADRGVQDARPPNLQTGVPNSVAGIVTNAPVPVPQLAAQQSVKISSASAPQLVVSQVPPRYPAAARELHIQGTVVVQAVIGKNGKIISVRATSGHPLLIQAAVDAVKQWQFRPYYLNGVPVEAGMEINVKFRTNAN